MKLFLLLALFFVSFQGFAVSAVHLNCEGVEQSNAKWISDRFVSRLQSELLNRNGGESGQGSKAAIIPSIPDPLTLQTLSCDWEFDMGWIFVGQLGNLTYEAPQLSGFSKLTDNFVISGLYPKVTFQWDLTLPRLESTGGWEYHNWNGFDGEDRRDGNGDLDLSADDLFFTLKASANAVGKIQFDVLEAEWGFKNVNGAAEHSFVNGEEVASSNFLAWITELFQDADIDELYALFNEQLKSGVNAAVADCTFLDLVAGNG